jgi:photosystem II stability/assembly factor-like uncharacterized protein
MVLTSACAAAPRPVPVNGAHARQRVRPRASWLSLALAASFSLGIFATAPARAVEPATSPTDTPMWRATHSLLLGLARAGHRIVAVGNAGTVLLSDDEGQTWRAAKTPTDELLAAVVFPTPREGWAVGQDELILHSTDAGETWTQVHMVPNADQTLFTIISIVPNHLLTSGAYNVILETTDGSTWKDSKIDNLDDDYHLNCAVARGNDVLITGESGHAFIRYAGAWTQMKLPYDGSQFACLVGADGSFYSFGLRGSAFRSLPGSADWTRLDLHTQASFFGATTLSDGRMALVGSNGTVDLFDPVSGKVTELEPSTDKTLSALLEGTAGKLIVVGEDGVHLIDIAAASDAGVSQ